MTLQRRVSTFDPYEDASVVLKDDTTGESKITPTTTGQNFSLSDIQVVDGGYFQCLAELGDKKVELYLGQLLVIKSKSFIMFVMFVLYYDQSIRIFLMQVLQKAHSRRISIAFANLAKS